MNDNFLYQPLKIKNTPVLFWGCLHLDHDPSWKIPLWSARGFKNVKDQNDSLLRRWISKADENTVGFLLGDNAFGVNASSVLETFIKTIPFKELYLMPGNHHAGWKQLLANSQNGVWDLGHKKVYFIPNYLEIIVNNQSIVLCHYPIFSWNGQGGGSWMLYSHVHGSLQRSELGRTYQITGKNCEVSVETCSYPVTLEDLQRFFARRMLFSPDHHTSTTQNPF
jgi:calcineurin-like phosphoesterase family protein